MPIVLILAGAGVLALYLVTKKQGQPGNGVTDGSLTTDGGGNGSDTIPPPLSEGNMTASDIAALAQNAGFSGDDLTTAVAIALAESSGNPVAYNPETAASTPEGMGSYGLWQIYRKVHQEWTPAQLYDPQTNANAAYAIYQAAGNSFRPWSTFKSGAYLTYINVAEAGVNA